MKLIITFCIGLFLSVSLLAQDIHLAQYYTSNLSLNPAYTGNFDGDIRATLNSRSQWSQLSPAIKTNMLSIEKKFVRRPNEFGLGFILINDQLSAMFLNTNKMYLSGSYQKNIHGHFFRFGIQGGIVLMNINLTNQTFPAQWDASNGQYDLSTTGVNGGMQNIWISILEFLGHICLAKLKCLQVMPFSICLTLRKVFHPPAAIFHSGMYLMLLLCIIFLPDYPLCHIYYI